MIEFRLNPRSGVPTYLQLVQQVQQALRLGILQPGDQLPTVKEVVSKLAINPNTVLKAYRELETKGLAAGRPGQGTFVQATLSQVALPELTALRRSLSRWLTAAPVHSPPSKPKGCLPARPDSAATANRQPGESKTRTLS